MKGYNSILRPTGAIYYVFLPGTGLVALLSQKNAANRPGWAYIFAVRSCLFTGSDR